MSEVGIYLKSRREELNISYEELYESTKIRTLYLKAIEEGNFESLPGEVYLRGFLRTISRELKVDYDHVLALYESETKKSSAEGDIEEVTQKNIKPNDGKKSGKSAIVWVVFGIIIVGCIIAAFMLSQKTPASLLF